MESPAHVDVDAGPFSYLSCCPMTRWSVAATVAMVLGVAQNGAAVCGFDKLTIRCRDGARTAVVTRVQLGPDGRTPVSATSYATSGCDADQRCDGVCTFNLNRLGFDPETVPVGQREDAFDSGSGCSATLICKKGRRARCRKLARQGSSTTTAATTTTTTSTGVDALPACASNADCEALKNQCVPPFCADGFCQCTCVHGSGS